MEYRIKDLDTNKRPREKIELYGIQSLSDEELIAIVLRNGIKGVNVIELASEILFKYKLNELDESKIHELSSIKGLGRVKAITLIAAIELGRRSQFVNNTLLSIRSSDDVYKYYSYDIKNTNQEHLKALFLNTKKKVIRSKIIFIGTVNSSTVHPRDIFREAVSCNAVGVIIMHNHPTGDVTPSYNDDFFTNKLVSIGKMIGIEVIDHIIVGNNNYYSYREKWDSIEKK